MHYTPSWPYSGTQVRVLLTYLTSQDTLQFWQMHMEAGFLSIPPLSDGDCSKIEFVRVVQLRVLLIVAFRAERADRARDLLQSTLHLHNIN